MRIYARLIICDPGRGRVENRDKKPIDISKRSAHSLLVREEANHFGAQKRARVKTMQVAVPQFKFKFKTAIGESGEISVPAWTGWSRKGVDGAVIPMGIRSAEEAEREARFQVARVWRPKIGQLSDSQVQVWAVA